MFIYLSHWAAERASDRSVARSLGRPAGAQNGQLQSARLRPSQVQALVCKIMEFIQLARKANGQRSSGADANDCATRPSLLRARISRRRRRRLHSDSSIKILPFRALARSLARLPADLYRCFASASFRPFCARRSSATSSKDGHQEWLPEGLKEERERARARKNGASKLAPVSRAQSPANGHSREARKLSVWPARPVIIGQVGPRTRGLGDQLIYWPRLLSCACRASRLSPQTVRLSDCLSVCA